ncbi:MAG: anti-sigma factor [Acidobacteria bacterium]|nr:anti-sigma factor [Acidobacteriota bacterium]
MDQETQTVDKTGLDDSSLSELIKKTGEGDPAAFAALYDGTSRLLFGLILRITAERTPAEEILLDVYTRIRKESAFYDPESLLPLEWIITAARACAVAKLDATREGRKRNLAPPGDNGGKMTVSPAMQKHARASLDSLAPQQKEFLDWAFYTGLSPSEIAVRIGKPAGAVKTHTRIGMSKLYELFRPLYGRETGTEAAAGDKRSVHEKPTEEIRESAALFSLGVLTQHEAVSFESHLREGCPVCETEYRKFRHITAEIGFAACEADAPDYIRELILARIEREPSAAGPEDKETPARIQAAPVSKPILTPPPAKGAGVFPWVLAVLFAAAAGFIFYLYHSGQKDKEGLASEMAAAQTEIKNLETLLDKKENGPVELEEIVSVVSRPETRIFHMAGLDPAPTASGAIVWDVQQNRCLVFGYIPPVSGKKAYQLWFLTSSNKNIPSGLLEPDPAGRVYDWFPIPEDISSLTMAITLEPEGGSKTPTLPYYAIGRND